MRTKKIGLLILSTMLVFSSFPSITLANEDKEAKSSENQEKTGDYTTKDEVVYGNLDAAGKIEDMYVVNTFRMTEPGKVVDYGNYASVRNLTNLANLENKEGKVQFQAEEEAFYYQGNMKNKSLPWDVSITYLLDGKEMEPQELAGKSGSLEIQISTAANDEVDPEFFENFLLQIAVTLDPTKFDNIQAPEGTKANAGQNKQINFSVMPEQEEEYIISADVSNFEMDPIEISAAPYSMSIESPDTSGVTGEMQELSNAISDVHSGVGELNDGVSELNQGAQELSDGSTDYRNGMNELNQSSSELINGSASIRDALTTINQTVQESTGNVDLNKLKEFPNRLREVASGLEDSAQAIDGMKQEYNTANQQLNETINGIPSHQISEAQFNELKESNADQQVIEQLIETYQAATTAKETYNAVKGAFDSVTGALDQSSSVTREMASNLNEMATEIEKTMRTMEEVDVISQIQEGLSSFSSNYQSFHNGLVSYTDGVDELASSYQELDAGIQELAKGTASTSDGVNELYSGTEELQEATSNLPGQVQQQTDEMMEEYDNSDYKPSSFVSDQNKHVEVVQFVLQTESIEIPEPESSEKTEEEEKGIWERFLDLFR
ncbi:MULTISPECIES: methyl-accepting chemotaxis protein [Virgibacillus]|uniref:YhgE/Pip domain-containing protein n=1 Tax=Virgibacillus kapii TaxID=1638645 RepID=A0ABQ2DRY7_9BACI|nr:MULTISPECIES: hypothetical protein [Virgibacillus]EQB36946.1 hypothetical protein M948_10995 [Virgibacillus sp. CM-4]GGJ64883.1 hypothetical protein GCM10007111_28450 [Virgibacillus kapii]